MSTKDQGLQELIDIVKSHPELFDQGEVEAAKIKRLLKKPSARALAAGVDPVAFASADGVLKPLRMCPGNTRPPCKVLTLAYVEKEAA